MWNKNLIFPVILAEIILWTNIAPAAQNVQSNQLSIEELFTKALAAKGDDYIKLRNAIMAGEDAISFLKARRSDQDRKPAIIAEAVLARIRDPQRYLNYERILRDAADEYFYFSSAHVRTFRPVKLEEENEQRVFPFLVELAVKDSVRYLEYPRLGYSDEFLEKCYDRYYDEEAYEELLFRTLCTDPNNMRNVTIDIEKHPPQEHSRILQVLESRSKDLEARALFREYATDCLALFDHPVVLPALVELLSTDKSARVRESAGEGIGRTRDSAGAVHLRAALKDEVPIVRIAAARALGGLADGESVDALIAALKDTSAQKAAAVALGQIGHPKAIEPLMETLRRHPHEAIAVSIGKIDLQALLNLLDTKQADPNMPAAIVARALGYLKDARSVPYLLARLHDENWRVRYSVADALGEIGDRRAVEPIIKALEEGTHSDVRSSAAEALGKIGDARALQPLISALKDESHHVRRNAVGALGEIGDSRALEALEAVAANDEHGSVRFWAELAVTEIRKTYGRSKKPDR